MAGRINDFFHRAILLVQAALKGSGSKVQLICYDFSIWFAIHQIVDDDLLYLAHDIYLFELAQIDAYQIVHRCCDLRVRTPQFPLHIRGTKHQAVIFSPISDRATKKFVRWASVFWR